MPVIYNPDSDYVKEMRKWEQFPSAYTWDPVQGKHVMGNPYVFREYPKMLYQARTNRQGKIVCMEPPPAPYDYERNEQYDRAVLANEAFNKSCYCIVANEEEERVKNSQGWYATIPEAVEALKKRDEKIADAAAETAFHAQHMSEKAQRELAQADAETHQHVTDVTGAARTARGTDRRPRGTVANPEQD